MPRENPTPNAPTSERYFTPDRTQVVTTKREPIIADFRLPELEDLRNLRGRRRQAYDLEGGGRRERPALASAGKPESDYDYEALYGQLGAGYMSGGVFPWEAGMPYGTGTTPVAIGSRRVRRR